MQFIGWDEHPPIEWPGIFNPSYCDNDSMLYFDDFSRLDLNRGEIWKGLFDGSICHDAGILDYPINVLGTSNSMPGISITGDTLFFCSDRSGTYGGLDIWMSIKSDTIWTEPINLGDSINTELNELAPHYASEIGTLFFDRLEQYSGRHFGLYKSIYYGDGIWQTAERLPEIINPIEYGNYSPFYQHETNTLYFNRFGNIYRSTNVDGQWNEPEILNDNVNGLWMPNVNDWVATRRAWISADFRKLFYSKEIWQYECIDFEYILFFSEWTVDIDEANVTEIPKGFSLSIYPNPSNSSFNFYISSDKESYDLTIYNMLGQLIKRYNNCTMPAITWDGTDINHKSVSTGIYFIKINSGKEVLNKKILLQK